MQPQVEEAYRLSPQQRWLWSMQRQQSGSLGAQVMLRLEGTLDQRALKQSLECLVARHQIFRTHYRQRPGMKLPLQVITRAATLEYVCDSEPVRDVWEEQWKKPFALESGVVLRARLMRLEKERHVLVLTMPALCADERTLQNLVGELCAIYEAEVVQSGRASRAEGEVQYVQYASWQNELQSEPEAEAGRRYWESQYGGEPEAQSDGTVRLPCESERVGLFVPAVSEQVVTLPAGVEEAAARNGVTVEALLLSAWAALLWRLSSVDEFIISTAFDGRKYDELQDALGHFEKLLPVRVQVGENMPCRHLMRRVNRSLRDCRKWQDYFIYEVFKKVDADSDGNALLPICFEYVKQETKWKAAKLVVSVDRCAAYGQPFKLRLSCMKQHDSLRAEIHYHASLYAPVDVARLADRFQTVVQAITRNPETMLKTLEVLGNDERRQIAQWNESAQEYEDAESFLELFARQVQERPWARAVTGRDRELSYRELEQMSGRLARRLRALGVGAESIVGVLAERRAATVAALLGVMRTGAAYLPIDPGTPAERMSYMLEEAGCAVMVVSEAGQVAPPPGAQVLWLEEAGAESAASGASGELEASEVGGAQLAYVIYTSGSSGRPKGVMVTHGALANYTRALIEKIGCEPEERYLLVSTLAADLGHTMLFPALSTGGEVVVADEEEAADGERLAQRLGERGVEYVKGVPTHLEALRRSGGERVLGRKLVVAGGEASRWEWMAELGSTGRRRMNHYGPTETTVGALTYEVEASTGEGATVPIGRVLPNVRGYVVERSGPGQLAQLAPVGVAGELYLGGAGLARGYLNRPELTAERFVPDEYSGEAGARLYRTGDVVRYQRNGQLEFLGRADEQVKVRGYRIEPGEIEAVLCEQPSVAAAVVIAREDEPGDQRLVAYLSAAAGVAVPEAKQLRETLSERLPDYMIPSHFIKLDKLPLTVNGKLDRRALPAPGEADEYGSRDYVAPRTPFEELIAGIWAEVLRVERVGVTDNFFELGGHSLLATQVVSRMREALGVEVSLARLFEEPTVEGLARRVEGEVKGAEVMAIERAERAGPLPLSFAQQRLWFLDQLEPNSALYVLPRALRFNGELNVGALRATVEEVVRRHESLRTTFAVREGQPVQVISAVAAVPFVYDDLSELAEEEGIAEARRLTEAEARQPFDLERGPLLRVRLLRLKETEHVVLFTMHHIVSDGWSMGVLVGEVTALYTAFSKGESSPLAELPIQYADFAVWQRRWLAGAELERQLDYWRQRLGGGLPVLKLPADRPRPEQPSFRGARQSFTLSAELSEGLRRLSRREGVTLFMTLLAGLQTLLLRYTGQEDVVVGADIANRTRVETERLIGFFINLLVLRTDLSGDPTFVELLKRVREVTLGAYAHQDLPFEKLVEELQPDRSRARGPLIQVALSVNNVQMQAFELPELRVSAIEFDNEISRWDLVLFVSETIEGLGCTWRYRTDLYDAPTIERMSSNFTTLLTNIVAQPDAPLSKLEILTEAERSQLKMEKEKLRESKFSKFRKSNLKPVDLSPQDLIKTSYRQPDQPLPLVIEPASDEVDLIDWAKHNAAYLDSQLLKHGAILFRGFNLRSVAEFEGVAQALCPQLFGDYGDLPREANGGKVYGSTPYPADQTILFHNESSHLHQWPMKISFFCVKAAQQGGETPIVDCRKLYSLLDPRIRDLFAQKKLTYVRNFTRQLDVSWQQFFKTTDRAVVEQRCREDAVEFQWLADDGLRTRYTCRAVATHPRTNEPVFFNQIQLHHVLCLDEAVRASLLSLFGEEGLPRNVYFGDGSPIDASIINEVQELCWHTASKFPWQEGDVLTLDNMLTAHARLPYEGARKIVVAMGEMFSEK